MTRSYFGVDLGASCGVVRLDEEGHVTGRHTWRKKPTSKTRPLYGAWAYHLDLLRHLLVELVKPGDCLAFERVRRHEGIQAAHAYGRVLGVIEEAAWLSEAELVEVEVAAIKRTATGKGRAEKAEMISAAVERWHGSDWDEHQADAAWCAETARRGEE